MRFLLFIAALLPAVAQAQQPPSLAGQWVGPDPSIAAIQQRWQQAHQALLNHQQQVIDQMRAGTYRPPRTRLRQTHPN